MLKSQLKFPGAGDDSILLVLNLPGEFISLDAPASCMSIPVMSREGGILLAIPSDYIIPHALLESAVSPDEDSLLGPSAEFEASLLEEDEEGNVERVPAKSRYLAIDFSDDILGYLRQYDPVTDPSAVIQPFDPERLEAIVDVKESLADIRRWLESLGDVPRANFHSAREEPATPKAAPKKTAKRVTAANLAVQVETLTAQVKMMAMQQQEMLLSHRASFATHAAEPPNGGHVAPRLPDASVGLGATPMPAVPKVAQLVGPPPKTKAVAASAANLAIPDTGETLEDMEMQPDPMSRALLQQSAALSTLVAHLTTGDALTDLSAASSSGASLSTKGVARRERLQQELSADTSNFFVQVQQQLFRKLSPSKPLPKTEEDLMLGGASMCEYLEKFGGYKAKPEMGMLMWLLAHMMDSAPNDEGVPRLDSSLCRTVGPRWGLESSLCIIPAGRTTTPCLLREASEGVLLRPSFRCTSPRPLGSSSVSLSQGSGFNNHPQDGSQNCEASVTKHPGTPKSPPDTSGTGSPPRRPKFPKKPKAGSEPQPKAS